MSQFIETFSAGDTKRMQLSGRYFRLISAAAVNVSFYRNRQKLDETVTDMSTGFYCELPGGFDEVEVYTGTAQTVKALISEGKVGFSDSVNVSNLPASAGAMTNSRATVLTSGVSTLLAANAARRYALVQNASTADTIRVTMDGSNPTDAQGIRIPPGGYWEAPSGYAPTGTIKAIAETGVGAAVESVEG